MAQDRSPIVADFFQAARMVALSDMARRKRDGQESLRKNLLAMLESVEAHANALRRFKITPGRVSAVLGDARDLRAAGVKEASVDAVVTSPPYSIALDYVKNDDHALAALGVNVAALRGEMTGVRGRRPKDKLALYNEDMQRMFREVARVLKPGARAAFVIGDATVDRQEHTTTREMGDWAVDAGLKREREIPKSCLASTTSCRTRRSSCSVNRKKKEAQIDGSVRVGSLAPRGGGRRVRPPAGPRGRAGRRLARRAAWQERPRKICGQKDTPTADGHLLVAAQAGYFAAQAGYFAAFFLRSAQEAVIRSETAFFSSAVIGRRFLVGLASDAVSATGVAAAAGRCAEERRAAGCAGAEVPSILSTSFNALISACRRSISL